MTENNINPVILFTGASGGIGRSLIPGLARAGFRLALQYYSGLEKLQKTVDELSEDCQYALFHADLSQESSITEMVQKVLETFGRIDILVNNAGLGLGNISWKESTEQWNKVMAVNLTAPFLLCRAVIPGMRQNAFGRIINISSVVAHIGMPGTTAYAASKAGLEGYTRSLSKELINKHITANCIAYGYMEAGMIDMLSEAAQTEILSKIPAGKFGETDNILSTILYLCAPETNYITGQTIHLNGGMYMS